MVGRDGGIPLALVCRQLNRLEGGWKRSGDGATQGGYTKSQERRGTCPIVSAEQTRFSALLAVTIQRCGCVVHHLLAGKEIWGARCAAEHRRANATHAQYVQEVQADTLLSSLLCRACLPYSVP
eukprot:362070-Chlamydomonas_euryale.AAC.1